MLFASYFLFALKKKKKKSVQFHLTSNCTGYSFMSNFCLHYGHKSECLLLALHPISTTCFKILHLGCFSLGFFPAIALMQKWILRAAEVFCGLSIYVYLHFQVRLMLPYVGSDGPVVTISQEGGWNLCFLYLIWEPEFPLFPLWAWQCWEENAFKQNSSGWSQIKFTYQR